MGKKSGFLRGVTAIAIAVSLSACVTDGEGGGLNTSFFNTSLFGGDSSKRYQVKQTDVPRHAKAVIMATVMRLKGAPVGEVRELTSVRNSGVVMPESGFAYGGFALRNVELLEYEAPDDGGLRRTVGGFLHFEDGYGRHASADFRIVYDITADGDLVIAAARAQPAFTAAAGVESYVVPAEAIEAGAAAVNGYGDLYRLVRRSAVRVRTGTPSPRAGDYAIVVFFQDRLPPGDEVEVSISAARKGTKGYTEATGYLEFESGWVAAILPGRFALSPDEGFWIKVLHKAKDADKPTLVGLFSTDPGAAPSS